MIHLVILRIVIIAAVSVVAAKSFAFGSGFCLQYMVDVESPQYIVGCAEHPIWMR